MSGQQIHRLLELAGQPIPKPAPIQPPLMLEVEPQPARDWRHRPAEPQPTDERLFAQLPAKVLHDRTLSAGARLLYAELALHAWRQPVQWLGRTAHVVRGLTVAQLGANVGVQRPQTQVQLVRLEEAGHVFRDQAERKLTVYVFGLVGR